MRIGPWTKIEIEPWTVAREVTIPEPRKAESNRIESKPPVKETTAPDSEFFFLNVRAHNPVFKISNHPSATTNPQIIQSSKITQFSTTPPPSNILNLNSNFYIFTFLLLFIFIFYKYVNFKFFSLLFYLFKFFVFVNKLCLYFFIKDILDN